MKVTNLASGPTSGRSGAQIGRIPKLTVRVRFPSPAPNAPMRPLHRPQPKIGAIRWPDSHQEAVPSFVPDTPVSPVNPLVADLPGAAASVALSHP
jgi:hypothetical protein